MMFTIRTHPITTRVHQIPGGVAGRIKSDDTVTRVHTCSYSTYLGRQPAYNPIADKYAAMYLIIYGSVKTPGTWKTNKTRLSLHKQTPADWHTRTHTDCGLMTRHTSTTGWPGGSRWPFQTDSKTYPPSNATNIHSFSQN